MKIFISHAVSDMELATPLVELLQLGCGVLHGDIFYSSRHGEIPNGDFFVNKILTALNDSELVIVLLSKSYLQRQFCLAELGAAQVKNIAKKGELFTLIVPPAGFGDLQAVLTGMQAGFIDKNQTIDELLENVAKTVATAPSVPIRNGKRDIFLASMGGYIQHRINEDLISKIYTLDLFFEHSPDPMITYKMKLRIVFKNDTGLTINVHKPRWTASANEMQCMPNENSSVQIETGAGWRQNVWSTEGGEQTVQNGKVFRTWIGLDWTHTIEEYRRLHESLAVGTLHVPIDINGQRLELMKKI